MRNFLVIGLALVLVCISACGDGNSNDNQCAVTNCHGSKVECGYSEPVACTAIYEPGDRCRSLVECKVVESNCQAVALAGYQQCVRCVEQCGNAHDLPDAYFQCESLCS